MIPAIYQPHTMFLLFLQCLLVRILGSIYPKTLESPAAESTVLASYAEVPLSIFSNRKTTRVLACTKIGNPWESMGIPSSSRGGGGGGGRGSRGSRGGSGDSGGSAGIAWYCW